MDNLVCWLGNNPRRNMRTQDLIEMKSVAAIDRQVMAHECTDDIIRADAATIEGDAGFRCVYPRCQSGITPKDDIPAAGNAIDSQSTGIFGRVVHQTISRVDTAAAINRYITIGVDRQIISG